ncbi:hypothetical protein KIN20_029995 [Parelaphostrongylus tenuis]|uniref:Uncharacterized protein n=1 Tax=Parelaphostrongylus tenuis TaxID=148309 RepID=A0AAD5R375_PARTN|nr:hypothetical protein KIN20_029995 [Parelaphostrongylus tenuis]
MATEVYEFPGWATANENEMERTLVLLQNITDPCYRETLRNSDECTFQPLKELFMIQPSLPSYNRIMGTDDKISHEEKSASTEAQHADESLLAQGNTEKTKFTSKGRIFIKSLLAEGSSEELTSNSKEKTST